MTWGILNHIRQRVSEEQGILRKPQLYGSPYVIRLPYAVRHEFARIPDNIPGDSPASGMRGAERAFIPDSPEEYRKHHFPVADV